MEQTLHPPAIKGRGAVYNPPNRFETISYEKDEEWNDPDDPGLRTIFYRDISRSVISRSDSPDLGHTASVNPYRGCEHGCAYCYARPTHEYLGMSAGFDFESKIMVKEDAPELLREEFCSRKWVPTSIMMSGVTDCYQPVERRLGLTSRCLEVFREFSNPVCIVTKNHLVTRDSDILADMAREKTAAVILSITSLDPNLARVLEPRASHPQKRLDAIRELTAAGVPVGVNVAPVIPAVNDHEIPAILRAAKEAGAVSAGYVFLRLPHAVAPLFEAWLGTHLPDRKDKVLNRIRASRGGKLYDSSFATRMKGEGIFARQIKDLFDLSRTKEGFAGFPHLSTTAFRRKGQMVLL